LCFYINPSGPGPKVSRPRCKAKRIEKFLGKVREIEEIERRRRKQREE
jgi:hypothetical protein